jgi:hypothetical protein
MHCERSDAIQTPLHLFGTFPLTKPVTRWSVGWPHRTMPKWVFLSQSACSSRLPGSAGRASRIVHQQRSGAPRAGSMGNELWDVRAQKCSRRIGDGPPKPEGTRAQSLSGDAMPSDAPASAATLPHGGLFNQAPHGNSLRRGHSEASDPVRSRQPPMSPPHVSPVVRVVTRDSGRRPLDGSRASADRLPAASG